MREEYTRYIHSAAWKKKANQRLELDNHICCVCGKEATEVHHLTYEHFMDEPMEDLVGLCRACHRKAEELYDPENLKWAMDGTDDFFMAAARTDAHAIAPIVSEYIKSAREMDFEALMELRQPEEKKKEKKYWQVLRKAVDALCRKRYYLNCVEDRTDILISEITNHVRVICLAEIEHIIRNQIQADLHDIVMTEYLLFERWNKVRDYLGISDGTLRTIRNDCGESYGPTLRETVFFYCGRDAAAGIEPLPGFSSLTEADYEVLKQMARYAVGLAEEEKGRTKNKQ